MSPADDTLSIVLQITDGGTMSLEKSQKILPELKKLGQICKAIQIAENLIPEEQEIFKEEWGKDGLELDALDNLMPLALKLLAEIIIFRGQDYSRLPVGETSLSTSGTSATQLTEKPPEEESVL